MLSSSFDGFDCLDFVIRASSFIYPRDDRPVRVSTTRTNLLLHPSAPVLFEQWRLLRPPAAASLRQLASVAAVDKLLRSMMNSCARCTQSCANGSRVDFLRNITGIVVFAVAGQAQDGSDDRAAADVRRAHVSPRCRLRSRHCAEIGAVNAVAFETVTAWRDRPGSRRRTRGRLA